MVSTFKSDCVVWIFLTTNFLEGRLYLSDSLGTELLPSSRVENLRQTRLPLPEVSLVLGNFLPSTTCFDVVPDPTSQSGFGLRVSGRETRPVWSRPDTESPFTKFFVSTPKDELVKSPYFRCQYRTRKEVPEWVSKELTMSRGQYTVRDVTPSPHSESPRAYE